MSLNYLNKTSFATITSSSFATSQGKDVFFPLPPIKKVNEYIWKPQEPYSSNRAKKKKLTSSFPSMASTEDIFVADFQRLFYDMTDEIGDQFRALPQVYLKALYGYAKKVGIQKGGYCWVRLTQAKIMEILKCKSLTTVKKVVNLLKRIGLIVTSKFIEIRKNRKNGRVRTDLYHAFNPLKVLEFIQNGVPQKLLETITTSQSPEILGQPFSGSQDSPNNLDITVKEEVGGVDNFSKNEKVEIHYEKILATLNLDKEEEQETKKTDDIQIITNGSEVLPRYNNSTYQFPNRLIVFTFFLVFTTLIVWNKFKYFMKSGPIADNLKCLAIIDGSTESDKKKQFRRQILQKVGPEVYYSWFMQGHFNEFNDKLEFVAGNSFAQKIWRQQFDWLDKAHEVLNR